MLKVLCVFFLSIPLFAQDLAQSFPKGSGSRFELTMDGVASEVVISVSESSKDRIGIKYFFSALKSGLNVQLWQQFVFAKQPGTNLRIESGYHFTPELPAPEKVPADKLKQLQNIGLGDFLLSENNDLTKFKIGEETVATPAGKVKAIHYRQTRDGSTTDFWISDSAKPLGLVKLNSTGKFKYQLSLQAVVKNVKPKIDPAKATAPTQKGTDLFTLSKDLDFLP